MKRILLFTMMCLFGLFSLNAQDLDGKSYKIKVFENMNNSIGVGQYLVTDPEYGDVTVSGTNADDAQTFTFESTGTAGQYYIKYDDGNYIGSTTGSVFLVSEAYPINVVTYPFGGKDYYYFSDNDGHLQITAAMGYNILSWGGASLSVLWDLEEVTTGEEGGDEPEPTPDPEPGDVCLIKFTLNDDYGDGWAASHMLVEYNGETQKLEFKTTSSYVKEYTKEYTLEIPSGAHVVLKFVGDSGSWPQENSFTVEYETGEVIWSKALGDIGSTAATISHEFDVDCTPKAPKAPVVKAEVLGSEVVFLSWNTDVTATSYNVYKDSELHVAGITTTTYTVEELSAGTAYCFTVTADNENGTSEPSEECCVTTFAEGEALAIIGEGDINQISAPIYNAGPSPVYSLSQQIYTKEEIGLESAANIYSISFHHATGNNNSRDIVVYLKNVDNETFEDNYNWIAFSDSDKVYEGVFDFGVAGDWITIDFQNEFEYTGGNLAVTVYDKTGTGFGYTYDICDKFYSYQVETWRGLYLTKTEEMDFSNLSTFYGTKMNTGNWGSPANVYFINNIKLKVALTSGSTPTPSIPAPQNLVATVNGQNSITLTWDAVPGAEDYYVYRDGQLWANTNGATTYTENGLTAGTEYCFNVTADGAAGESELSEQVCATTESIELAENEILIGTATTKYYSPFLANLKPYGGTWFEVIYKSEEIGQACTISELAFSYNEGTGDVADINIYLAEVEKSEHANPNDFTAESELKLVYSGTNVAIADEAWETFVLDTPFVYSGENNLVVIVSTLAESGRAIKWDCYEDANTALIALGTQYPTEGYTLDKHKPVLKLTLGEESETPVDLLPYRLQSITGEYENNNLYYVYSEDESRVEKITEGSYATLVDYNEDGTVAKTSYVFIWNGTPDYSSDYTVTDYTYTDGVLTSYTETKNYNWRDPETSEYALSYNEDGTVAEVTVDNRKYAYEYEDGKLVKETYSYYDQWAYPEPGYVSEYIKEFEYDENGNCVTETKYNAYQNPPVAQSGVDYFYDLNVEADSVYVFAYPHEVLPARANLVTKAVSYSYNEDWATKEVTKGNFSVKTYNYNEEVVNAPVAPVNLAAKVLNDTKVELTWETLEEVESFKVYNGTTLVEEGVDTVYYLVEGLEPLTEYTFTVVAVNGELESAASEEAKVTTYNLVNAVPNEVAFGNVVVGDYWSEKSSIVSVEINRFGKDVKQIKTDNSFFRVPASITLTDDPIKLTVNYKKNAEAGEYEGNLLVILASDDTVSFPLTATAYTPVTPDVFELAQAIETVDGLFSDMPDFAALTDDYNLPNEAEGNNPDAVYSFTLAEEASVEINVEGSWDAIYAVYNAAFEGNGPSTDNNVEPTDRVYSTAFAYDFEDGSLEDFEIQDNDGDTVHTMKVEDGALITWGYRGWYDENYNWQYFSANERAITKEAYNITEKSVLTFDAQFIDEYGYGQYGYYSLIVQVTKDGETYTDVYYPANVTYSTEFESYRVDLGAKFAENGLEYGEYKVVFFVNGGNGTVAIDNIDLSERAWVYPAGDYYIVAAASSDFKVTVKSDALPELELNKEAHYRLVSTELDFASTRYNYASKVGTKVVNVKNNDLVDFLKYNDEGLLLGFVSCYMDENGGIYDTISELEYIYEDSVLVGYKEAAAFGPSGQAQEMEYVFNYNADGRIDTVRCEASNEVTVYTYNAEGLLVEKTVGYDYDGEFSFDSKEVYTYADNNLVKVETMYYDWEAAAADTLHILPLDSLFSLAEEKVYEYDSLGNVISAKSYECYYDEYNDTLIKNLWTGVDYVYDYSIAYENVFYFEYPHYAYSSYTSPAQPSHANIILAEDSYYAYFDYDKEEYVYHTQTRKTYRYEEYELESEDAPVAPATPENFVATATSDSTIVLTWNAVEGALTYNVYQGTETLKEGLTDTTYTVTGLAAATTYTFEVVAVNGELVSNRASATAKTLDATPDTPVVPVAPAAPVVKAEATSDTTIVLTWNKVEGALTYNVYQGTDTVAIATALTDTTYVVKGLTANTEYTFGVTAVNEAGESARGEAKAKTLEGEDGIEELNATVEIYPNPAVDRLVIETDSYVEEVSIYAITGTLIYREVDFNSNTIDVSTFDGGVYIMKVRTENGEVVKRFVKK